MVDDINYLILEDEDQEPEERPADVKALGYKDDADYDRMQAWIKQKQEEYSKWLHERMNNNE